MIVEQLGESTMLQRATGNLARPLVLVVAAVLRSGGTAAAQQRLLTLDDIYDPDKRVDFSGSAPSGLTWLSDTHYLAPQPATGATGGGTQLMKVDAATG